MWDVVWTDGARESRKEHRERKATKRAQGDKRLRTANPTLSRGSTSSSDGPGNPGFHGLRSGETSKSLASLSPTSTSFHSSPTVASFDTETDRLSSSSVSYVTIPVAMDHTRKAASKYSLHPEQHPEGSQDSEDPYTGADKNNVNNPTTNPHKSQQVPRIISLPWDNILEERVALEPCQFIQILGEGSFVFRSTRVTTTLRTPSDNIFGLNSKVTISASSTRPRSSDSQSQLPLRKPGNRVPTRPPPILTTPRRVPSSSDLPTSKSADGWKPPRAWDCTPTIESFPPILVTAVAEEERSRENVEASNDAQQEIKHSATQDNAAHLIQLQEAWRVPECRSSQKSLPPEAMQQILATLRHLESEAVTEPNLGTTRRAIDSQAGRILAIHDTPATASYLAATHNSKQVYHLTSTPHSHILSPNIQQILVPGTTPASFPVAPSFFEVAHSLRLLTLTASPDIPVLLQNIHRCLEPGGMLKFVLLDPLPLASSLGPLLRAWIEQNLLLNLEKSFRCTSPTKLVPVWLTNASFRVEPRHVREMELLATSVVGGSPSDAESKYPSEERIMMRLEAQIGWMLWVEIWGEYIVAERWWWEVPEIMEECKTRETAWRWLLIKAYKDI